MNDAQREAYRQKMEAKLERLKADMRHVRSLLDERKADARLAAEERLSELNTRLESVQTRLDKLKIASESAWAEVRDAAEGAWNELETAFDDLRSDLEKR